MTYRPCFASHKHLFNIRSHRPRQHDSHLPWKEHSLHAEKFNRIMVIKLTFKRIRNQREIMEASSSNYYEYERNWAAAARTILKLESGNGSMIRAEFLWVGSVLWHIAHRRCFLLITKRDLSPHAACTLRTASGNSNGFSLLAISSSSSASIHQNLIIPLEEVTRGVRALVGFTSTLNTLQSP